MFQFKIFSNNINMAATIIYLSKQYYCKMILNMIYNTPSKKNNNFTKF